MNELADSEVLERYVAGGAAAEAAFAEIVRRHGGLVYAACRRQLGDAAAEDAVQAVFMLLARKARTLSRKEALAGWLYGAASLVAREHLRAARRRKSAEKEAAEMRQAEKRAPADPRWSEVRPELDAALGALPRHYRDAVVLSCLEGKPEAEVARELKVPAGTVKSRVSRGLEALRERLSQRGTVTSAAALAGWLAAHGVETMPAALAAKVSGLGALGAAAAGAGAGSASVVMMEGAMKAMFWVKIKVAAAVFAAAAAVGGAGGTVAVKLAAGEPKAEPPKVGSSATEKGIECRVTAVLPGGKVLLSAGAAQGVKEKFEFEVSRDDKKVGEVKAVTVEEKQTTAEVTSVTGEIQLGDKARTRFGTVLAQPGEKPPAPAEAGKVAWGEAANGLQAGLIPLGDGATKDWKGPFCPNPKCGIMEKTAPGVGKCRECAKPTGSTALQYCDSCAAAKRICQGCGAAKPWGASFAEGEPLRLEVHVKNLAAGSLKLVGAGWRGAWQIEFQPAGAGNARRAACREEVRAAPDVSLPGNAQSARTIVLDNNYEYPAKDKDVREFLVPKSLAPGKYAVTASYEHAEGHPQWRTCPYWHGKVATGAVEVEIKPKGAAGADKVSWGQPANDLRAGLAVPGSPFPEYGPLTVELRLQATGERDLVLARTANPENRGIGGWSIKLTPGDRGQAWRLVNPQGAGPIGSGAEEALAKEQQKKWTVKTGGDWVFVEWCDAGYTLSQDRATGLRKAFDPASGFKREIALRESLPPGKYVVTAAYGYAPMPPPPGRNPNPPAVREWTGSVSTGAVEIEVKAKGAAAAGDWQKLFADEAWYKGQAGEEKVFTGTLEAVKPPEASTLMRNSLYRLGERTIYTGAKKLPALDALVGKPVEVRGKAVDMNLEGQDLKELWPASVRAAP